MPKIFAAGLIATLFSLSLQSYAADPVELNLGHVLTPGSHYDAVATRMAEIVERKSNGTLKIKVFPSGQLGGEVKLIQAARTGAISLAVIGEPPLETTVKEYGLFSMPYLFPDLAKANQAMQGTFGKHMLSYLDQHGLVGLGWISSLERNVYGRRKIEKPADLDGMKIRVIQSPGYIKTYEMLGAQPTPMAYSEVFLALQTGVIDGGEASPDTMIDDKFAEVSKYYNLTKTHYMPAILIMSKSRMDKLSPEHQKILRDAAGEAVLHGVDVYTASYNKSLEQIRKQGVEIVTPDLNLFRAKTDAIYQALLPAIPDSTKNFALAREAAK